MRKKYENLLKKFEIIARKGYIQGISQNKNSIGLTFEKELGKKADSMFWADFEGIEIKCKSRFSHFPICLFTQAFDGPYLYQTNVILVKYGKKSAQFPGRKTLISDLSCNKLHHYNDNYFQLKVDNNKKKIWLQVYDNQFRLIEEEAYIDFSTIQTKLVIKLNLLALVKASQKIINNQQYHRYYKIAIYQLISFDKFIELLKSDIIKTRIELRICKNGLEKGRQRNKNIIFLIYEQNLNLLYKEIYKVNYDNYWNKK